MQYIRDEDENFQEKRSKMNSVWRRSGGPLVVHAGQLYTSNVHDMFCKIKEKSESYRCIEVVLGHEYIAEHYDLEHVQRWCKGRYQVLRTEDCSMYSCECGLYEHFGLPCRHILRVLISNGLQKIPDGLIMHRWTKKARSGIPAYMQGLRRENPELRSQSYRHSSIMISLLEFAEIADSNVETYKIGMQFTSDAKVAMSAHSDVPDGYALADRQNCNTGSAANDVQDEFPLRLPLSRREKGRLMNRRSKVPGEVWQKRPRFCSKCKSNEHNVLTCPLNEGAPKPVRKKPKCPGCGLEGHKINSCGKKQMELMALMDTVV